MSIRQRLIVLNFLELFIWGTWVLSAGAYMATTLHFNGVQIGSVYATLGVVSLFMPALAGVVADRWIRAEKLLGMFQLILVGLFIVLVQVKDFTAFYSVMFLMSMCYMPTLALNNSISFHILEKNGYDIVKTFPSIRVWGTIGFIIAAWCVDAFQWKVDARQFYLGAGAALVMGLYAFTLPKVPASALEDQTLVQRFGLDALVLFKDKKIIVFFFFAILIGAASQITNIWGVPFLSDFEIDYKDSFAVRHSVVLMTLSQISEVFFILVIPFFLKKYGIKIVVLISMFAWMFRFGLFGIGTPEGIGLGFLILSMIVYGMAFDFFFISGALFIDKVADQKIRFSAQGLLMTMTLGVGPVLGGYGSGYIVDLYTEYGARDWYSIWMIFAVYALVMAVLFGLFFRYKHVPEAEIVGAEELKPSS